MTYTHTSAPVGLTEQAFCGDCGNPLPAGALGRRRVTDTGKRGFKIDWLCAGACGPIIDVSDHTLMRKRIAELEEEVSRARADREFALELALGSADEATVKVSDSEASVRIQRILDAIIITVAQGPQGPQGNATHITLTPEEARVALDLLYTSRPIEEADK
jgi:hypothetical protein